MISKKNNILIASILAVFSFFMIAYSSCKKAGSDNTRCKNVVCRNGGNCNQANNKCSCPVGYEDSVCGTKTVGKYYSNWGVKQTIMYSDSVGYAGTDTFYTTELKATATPTTFYFTNFNNNPYYSNVLCTLDETNSYHFRIDTISPFQMFYYSYQLLSGEGNLNKTKDTITAKFVTRHRNFTSNWQVDSVRMVLARHDY